MNSSKCCKPKIIILPYMGTVPTELKFKLFLKT